MNNARFKADYKGLGQLLRSSGVRGVLKKKVSAVERAAIAGAPVRSGDYQRSIHVESDTTDRAVERVVADVPYAFAVEFDTRNLGRALDAAKGA